MTLQPQPETEFEVQIGQMLAVCLPDLSISQHQNLVERIEEIADDYYTRSRPARILIDTTNCFDDLVYSSTPWKIYRQDAGMGEHDYAVFLNDVFFCRTEHAQTAHEIIRAMKHRP